MNASTLNTGSCRRCARAVPASHGHCFACGHYVDGFDSGANYCDDFEGTTSAEALAYRDETGPETFDGIGIGPSDLNAAAGETIEIARERFLAGMLAGLRVSAEQNAERAKEDAEEIARCDARETAMRAEATIDNRLRDAVDQTIGALPFVVDGEVA